MENIMEEIKVSAIIAGWKMLELILLATNLITWPVQLVWLLVKLIKYKRNKRHELELNVWDLDEEEEEAEEFSATGIKHEGELFLLLLKMVFCIWTIDGMKDAWMTAMELIND